MITLIGSATINYNTTSFSSSNQTTASEVTVALTTLQQLSDIEENIEDLQKYVIFIRGILDFADRLSISQSIHLFQILCKLACAQTSGGSNLMDELFILVRKYLGLSDTFHKQMGVIGCCSILQYYKGDNESLFSIFHFCLKSTRSFPENRLFFYKQLGEFVERGCYEDDIVDVDYQ